ncbi:MAG: HIT family protein [Candidatus Woesearchaeota archaeon]
MELSEEQKKALEEQKKNCPFCKIIAGEIPSQKVYEDEHAIAIMDINPLKEGHVLVLPKEHYPVMALLPPPLFEHMADLLSQMSKHLREAMLAKHINIFVANGAVAGQQAGHFMIHLIPSDTPLPAFSPSVSSQDAKAHAELRNVLSHNIPLMMKNNAESFPETSTTTSSQTLAELLEENPDFKQTLIDTPEAIIEGIKDNPSLQPLFEGVDVHALSKQLQAAARKEPIEEPEPAVEKSEEPTQPPQEVPQAITLTDAQLRAYLAENTKLKEYLENNLQALTEAIPHQPKLQAFFTATTPEEVLERLQPKKTSLDDLAGGEQ